MKQLMIAGLMTCCLGLLALDAEATRPATIPALVGKTVQDAKNLLDDIPIKVFDTDASGNVILRNTAMSDLSRSIDEQTRPQGESVPTGPLPAGYYVGLILYTPPPPPVEEPGQTGEDAAASTCCCCSGTTKTIVAIELGLIVILLVFMAFKKPSP